ncbi:GH25 family lysozyme [Lactobacillus xylocopicola]|uniref:Lysozyme n=1 Tax=Lactobacillus xylocopicola TaxID=2976676 RepID=A0ABN6SIP3_9LACO|nr:GH25 family lysozyme [Lactobacillus xylocopicola]BDR60187.1 lysozyme [Lactobacillus xylocopicola]
MKRFHHKYTLPAIVLLLVAAVVLLLIGLANLRSQTTLPPDANSSAIGVELNQNYGYVDLHELQENGVSFVYLKSTQGRSYFDDDYLSYRDQVLGTKLAFGTSIVYSNESTPQQHYHYFLKKVGTNTGTLPILLEPAVAERSVHYLKQMAHFAQMLESQGKRVMIELEIQYKKYFPADVLFATSGKKAPNKLQYSFWRYTNTGRVKGVSGLEDGVAMLAYNGTVMQYKQKYGQLTQ